MVIGLVKALENVRLVLDRNAIASILNRIMRKRSSYGRARMVTVPSGGVYLMALVTRLLRNLLQTLGIDI